MTSYKIEKECIYIPCREPEVIIGLTSSEHIVNYGKPSITWSCTISATNILPDSHHPAKMSLFAHCSFPDKSTYQSTNFRH